MPTSNLIEKVKSFKDANILVFGDAMLDEYIFGVVDRISPEAPVPVVHKERVEYTPGGAANVAVNIVSLQGEPLIMSSLGDDEDAEKLKNILREEKISTDHLLFLKDFSTIKKIRVIGGTQQIVRLDVEEKLELDGDILSSIKSSLAKIDKDIHCIIVSDYGKGLITPQTLDLVKDFARKWNSSIVVDPKVSHFEHYHNTDLITPNHKEAGRFVGYDIVDEKTMNSAGIDMLDKISCSSVLITWGERGMVLFEGDDIYPIPTFAREVYDVVGAGDTVIATVALAISAGCSMKESALISNHSAGIVVGKSGTASVSPEELIKSLEVGEVG